MEKLGWRPKIDSLYLRGDIGALMPFQSFTTANIGPWHFSGDKFNDDGWCYSIFLETSAHLCLFKLPNYTTSESSGSGIYIYWISPWDTFIDEYSSYFGIRIGIMNRANLAFYFSVDSQLDARVNECDKILSNVMQYFWRKQIFVIIVHSCILKQCDTIFT